MDHYERYRNTLTKVKRSCKIAYYNNKYLDYKNNTKALWRVINSITHRLNDKSSIIDCLKDGDLMCKGTKSDHKYF